MLTRTFLHQTEKQAPQASAGRSWCVVSKLYLDRSSMLSLLATRPFAINQETGT